MTVDKCREIVDIYRNNLANFCRGAAGFDIDTDVISPSKFPEEESAILDSEESVERSVLIELEMRILQHLGYMLDQMDKFLDKGQMEKFFRWLGFIQGVCWCSGYQTLKELKDLNRPYPDTGEATVGDPSKAEISI